ncbi:MAG: S8 family serine peptidase [Bacteroidota bacterium]
MIRMPIILISLFLFIVFSSTLVSQKKGEYARGTVIVKFKSIQQFSKTATKVISSKLPRLDIVFQRYNVIESRPIFNPENSVQYLRTGLGMDRVYLLHFNSTANVDSIVSDLSTLPDVEYAEPDFIGHGAGAVGIDSLIPNDKYFNKQWAFRNNGSNLSVNSGKAGADIKATMAWDICTGDTNIIVADLDTGLKWDHPDIADRVWINSKETPGNGIDDDNNGYVDDIHGWNFAYGNNNVSDDYGHGTNTASIIAAKSNNGLGYAGLDWACKIMPLKELDSIDSGSYSWWAAALYYAANNGARVINMSEGGTGNSQTLKTAIDYAYAHGCFIAAAMMNTNDSTKYYPAAYHDHVVAVGATDSYDRRCNPFFWGGGSNYGSWIDVVAPGNIIYGLNNASNTDYSWYWGGTSQATPMVAGLASLLLAQDSSRNPATLRDIIRATADDTVGLRSEDTIGYDVFYGYGRINCFKALTHSSTGIFTDHSTVLSSWILRQNYPNPFNPTTTIGYFVPTQQHITLHMYDLLGRNVARLVDGVVTPGEHVVVFDASGLASGIYFYRLQAESFINTKKLILLR